MATEVSVASVVYNMAGDEGARPDYLKTLLVRGVFSQAKNGVGKTIQHGLLNGPAMRFRSFYRWASIPANYDQIGIPTGAIQGVVIPTFAEVEGAITPPVLETVTVTETALEQADAYYWALKWVRENRPGDVALDWTYSIDEDATDITITWPGGAPLPATNVISVGSPTYVPGDWYVYATYTFSGSPTVIRSFIYALGTGSAVLDDLLSAADAFGNFFPFIPVRLNNAFLSESNLPAAYTQATKAYKRATGGGKLTDLITSLEDNPNLPDIDYAYIVFGVSLNVLDNSCRRYLYEFFDLLRYQQIGGPSSTNTTQTNVVEVKGSTAVSASYRMVISWKLITEISGSGLGKVGAKVNELWFETFSSTEVRLFWQITDSTYTYLRMRSLTHKNYVYQTKSVNITAANALADLEESGFIVPLQHGVWRAAGLISTSQMATACVFIVFNCVEIYKLQWYETFIFKIVLVVVIAVVSVLVFGPAGVGVLGANLVIGTTLGLTGLTAAIVGAVVNALAAMILISLLEPALQDVFGSFAPIVSAIIMFAIGSAAGSFTSTGTIVIDWSNLLRADNLLAMTQAVGAGVTNQINQDSLKLQQSGLEYQQNAQLEINKIQQAFFEEFGYGAGVIDPMMLVDAPKGPIAESSSTFLTRTLMTGSEIAEMSRQLLYEFPAYSLKLPDAFT